MDIEKDCDNCFDEVSKQEPTTFSTTTFSTTTTSGEGTIGSTMRARVPVSAASTTIVTTATGNTTTTPKVYGRLEPRFEDMLHKLSVIYQEY